jgi:hypothetical protein
MVTVFDFIGACLKNGGGDTLLSCKVIGFGFQLL